MLRSTIRAHQQATAIEAAHFIENKRQGFEEAAQAFPEIAATVGTYLAGFGPGDLPNIGASQRPGVILVDRILDRLYHESPKPSADRTIAFRDTILPFAGIPRPTDPEVASSMTTASVGVCQSAEGYFVDAAKMANARILPRGKQKRVSVYHTADGQPVAIRKSYEITSALALAPIGIAGLTLPPGVIVGIGYEANSNQTGSRVKNNRTLSTYEVSDVMPLEPRRISPWVYPKSQDRALFSLPYRPDRKRTQLITNWSLEDFRDTAHRIMQLCQAD